MCCFSGPVTSVSTTNIFARRIDKTRQAIVYGMTLDTPADVAMVLPIPVLKGSGEKAVSFINLEKYPAFFTDLQNGFPRPPTRGAKTESARTLSESKPLAVVQVGAFEASFVPSPSDFARLDKRFRLPDGTFEKLPGYRDFGFAVFKLKKGKSKVHPMAFNFPTRWPNKLFFPTVHIHDGKVHKRERFDHNLYLQADPGEDKALRTWTESPELAPRFMDIARAKKIVAPTQHCYWRRVAGTRDNKDITV